MALVSEGALSVCVDRYEAAVAGAHFSQPLDAVDAEALRAESAKGVMPQVNVPVLEAEAASGHAGKRLCTEAEWTSACRGPQHLAFPLRQRARRRRLQRLACPSPVPAVFRTIPGGAGSTTPRLAEAPNGIAPAGSFPKCVSADGLFGHMHGNVHEMGFDLTPKADDPRFSENSWGASSPTRRENGVGCAYKTTAHLKAYHDYSIGFRCCCQDGTR